MPSSLPGKRASDGWTGSRRVEAMQDASTTWKEMKAKFLREFTPAEQLFFLKKARECVNQRGYPVSEDLFQYCWFLTLAERLRLIDPHHCEGLMRFLLVESRRDIQGEAKHYERRLEAKKLPAADRKAGRLLEYLAS
jgi:hypothetical protein